MGMHFALLPFFALVIVREHALSNGEGGRRVVEGRPRAKAWSAVSAFVASSRSKCGNADPNLSRPLEAPIELFESFCLVHKHFASNIMAPLAPRVSSAFLRPHGALDPPSSQSLLLRDSRPAHSNHREGCPVPSSTTLKVAFILTGEEA